MLFVTTVDSRVSKEKKLCLGDMHAAALNHWKISMQLSTRYEITHQHCTKCPLQKNTHFSDRSNILSVTSQHRLAATDGKEL